jgi:hypothetical protein
MHCVVDGREVAPLAVMRVAMNYGQPGALSGTEVPYRLEVPLVDFERELAPIYWRAVAEDKADGPFHAAEHGAWPALDRLEDLGYPSLVDLKTAAPDVLESLVQEWLDQELLDRLLPGPGEGLPDYLIISLDRVRLTETGAVLEGRALPHPQKATGSHARAASRSPTTP